MFHTRRAQLPEITYLQRYGISGYGLARTTFHVRIPGDMETTWIKP